MFMLILVFEALCKKLMSIILEAWIYPKNSSSELVHCSIIWLDKSAIYRRILIGSVGSLNFAIRNLTGISPIEIIPLVPSQIHRHMLCFCVPFYLHGPNGVIVNNNK